MTLLKPRIQSQSRIGLRTVGFSADFVGVDWRTPKRRSLDCYQVLAPGTAQACHPPTSEKTL